MSLRVAMAAGVLCIASFAGTYYLIRDAGSDAKNLALGMPTNMSSMYGDFASSFGVDGNNDGMRNFFHTTIEDQPWWEVDLKREYTLSSVEIFNRSEHPERATKLTLRLSSDGRTWRTVYAHDGSVIGGSKDGKPLKVPLKGTPARFVRVQLSHRNYLHLSEVRVVGK